MKMKVFKNLSLLAFALTLSFNALLASASVDPKGTWSYEALQAPPEYSKGNIVFTEKDGKLEGTISVGGGPAANLQNVKMEGDEVSFNLSVEGDYITVKLKMQEKTFSGTASSSMGVIDLVGKKEEK
jgi:hypothetical protein